MFICILYVIRTRESTHVCVIIHFLYFRLPSLHSGPLRDQVLLFILHDTNRETVLEGGDV